MKVALALIVGAAVGWLLCAFLLVHMIQHGDPVAAGRAVVREVLHAGPEQPDPRPLLPRCRP